jgi:hypothetical protein
MNPDIYQEAENILYNLWFTIAENIFKRTVQVAQLDEEQTLALKQACLRPNDFCVVVRGVNDGVDSED